jgi:hypothetical protein
VGSIIAGLIFVVTGVLLWAGKLSLDQAFIIYLIVLGVALVLFGFRPAVYTTSVYPRRRA